MEGEPVEAGAQQLADQRGDHQHGGGRGDGQEVRPQGEPAECVEVVRQRAHGGALRRRCGEQRGSRALLGDRPQAFADTGQEHGDQDHHECLVRHPVDPQRRDDQQGETQRVRPDHQPAPVDGAAGRGERRQRPQEYGSEEHGGKNPGTEHGGDGKGRPAVSGPEGALEDRRLQRQQHKHEKGE